MTTPRMRLHEVGPSAVLVELPDTAGPADAAALAAWARERVAAIDVVPAARTVLLDGVVPADVEVVLSWTPSASPADVEVVLSWTPSASPADGPLVELPVRYDGPDLARVAELWGGDPAELLGAITLTSAFCGFAPGFAYLTGLPPSLHVPRLASPRARVPAGSVAVAGAYCGVYPTASPGGWNLVGSTDARLWDPEAEQPALLAPGTRARFVPC